MLKSLLNRLQPLIRFSLKNHWLFLILILSTMWLTGKIMEEPFELGWILQPGLARKIHRLVSNLVVIMVIFLAFDKLYLFLKSKGKI